MKNDPVALHVITYLMLITLCVITIMLRLTLSDIIIQLLTLCVITIPSKGNVVIICYNNQIKNRARTSCVITYPIKNIMCYNNWEIM